MFGSVLTSNDTLGANQQYTFTFTLGGFSILGVSVLPPSPESVQQEVSQDLANIGAIVSVKRPFLSSHYEIVVAPYENLSLNEWLNNFDAVFKYMGYPDYTFIRAEGGAVSTSPGGIEEALTGAGEVVGGTTASVVKSTLAPLLPYLLIGGAIYVGILMLPSLLSRRGN